MPPLATRATTEDSPYRRFGRVALGCIQTDQRGLGESVLEGLIHVKIHIILGPESASIIAFGLQLVWRYMRVLLIIVLVRGE